MTLAAGDTRDAFEGLWWHVYAPTFLGVIAIVFAATGFAIVRYRRRRQPNASRRSEAPVAELVYVVVLAGIAATLFTFSFRTGWKEDATAASPGLRVDVTGFQWGWTFRYPDDGVGVTGTYRGPPELVLPAGTSIEFTGTSVDVIHSFFVPHARFKRDVLPGETARWTMRFDRQGVFSGHCAEFCGLRHARMDFQVRVVSAADFRRWLAGREAAA